MKNNNTFISKVNPFFATFFSTFSHLMCASHTVCNDDKNRFKMYICWSFIISLVFFSLVSIFFCWQQQAFHFVAMYINGSMRKSSESRLTEIFILCADFWFQTLSRRALFCFFIFVVALGDAANWLTKHTNTYRCCWCKCLHIIFIELKWKKR